ncbi:MAG: hypothetical protein PHE54_03985 [Bacilli bacterium]|nr:hypothetical protein [Bacilli bacterium]
MEETLKKILFLIIAIILAILAVKFVLLLLPIILILLIANYIYSKLTVNKITKTKKEPYKAKETKKKIIIEEKDN